MPAASIQSLSGFLTSSKQTLTLGSFREPRKVLRAHIEVITGFNSDGTDQIRIGHNTDDDAYVTLTAVNAAGIQTVTLGTGVGYDATPREVIAQYVNGGSEPSQGSAIVTLEVLPCPPNPA